MSELVREWWDEMNAYGRAKADVVPLVKEVRGERRTRQNSRRPAK